MNKKKSKKPNRIVTEKSPVLYELGKLAGSFSSQEIRKWLDERKTLATQYIKAHNVDLKTQKSLGDEPGTEGLIFPANSVINTKQLLSGKSEDYFSLVNTLAQGVWAGSRKVYEISEGALEYINSDIPCFGDTRRGMNFCQFRQPCFITYPDGSGFFFAMTTIQHELFYGYKKKEELRPEIVAAEYEQSPVFLIVGLGAYDKIGICGRCDRTTTLRDLYQLQFHNIENCEMAGGQREISIGKVEEIVSVPPQEVQDILKQMFRTLFYLSYLQTLIPSEYAKMGHEEVTEGSPSLNKIKVKGMEQDWSLCPIIEGYNLNTYGVHPHLGFLSPSHMREFMRSMLVDLEESRNWFEDPSVFHDYLSFAAWSEHGTTFSVNDKTLSSLEQRYTGKLSSLNWKDLLSYIPMPDILLSFPDRREGCMVNICDSFDGLSLLSLDRENVHTKQIRYENLAGMVSDHILAVLAHVGTYYKLRQEKMEEKLTSYQAGKDPVPHAAVSAAAAQKPSVCPSYDVDVEALLLYDVTPRSVQRVKNRVPCGWSVVPHVRRKHEHRYWVGTGEQRHLEKRIVDKIIVNKDKVPVMRVHDIV